MADAPQAATQRHFAVRRADKAEVVRGVPLHLRPDKPKPGIPDDRLKIDMDFDDAAKRLVGNPPPNDKDDKQNDSCNDTDSADKKC